MWVDTGLGYEVRFAQTCDCCGATFKVSVPGLKGHEGPATYFCPECHKESRCKASDAPRVTLISHRTDGLSGACSR